MRRTLLLGLGLGLLSGCPATAPIPTHALPPPLRPLAQKIDQRAGVALPDDPFGDGADRLMYLDQNWAPLETLWFYFADQGSVLLPYATLVNLEQADGTERFVAPANLVRYRFLLQQPTPNNPDALPVGFAKHEGDGEPMAGLTCAACHATQIVYDRTAVRIDGGPSLIDMLGFLEGLRDAMAATLADEAKFARFAKATAGDRSAAAVRTALARDHAWFVSYLKAAQTTTQAGHGRVDAIGLIFNQVIRMTSGPENALEPNAPASYPLLWDAPRHDYVQWAGFSSNAGPGSLARNTGQVVGVFGQVKVQKHTTEEAVKAGYDSTIETHELVAMEEALRKLTSPQWPEQVLPPIDRALAKTGEALYARRCSGCHALIDRDDADRKITAQMYSVDKIGTDPLAVQNLTTAKAPTGILEGAWRSGGQGTYGAVEPVNTLLGDLVRGVLARNKVAVVKALTNAKLNGQGEETPRQGQFPAASEADPGAPLRTYKARPLNGIWAASPYLHNGSVPTLYDLLLPATQRPQTFATGRWSYDPKKVGYVSDSGPFTIDTRLPGNRNTGHEFGADLADGERLALVEYLKTL
ncbi:MAG: hypothetical protein H6702_24670 [Myxococcales bacterium]|nr:hypothetical protein [Myxococcales bacterium]